MFGLNKGFLSRFTSKCSNIFCFEINRFFCFKLLFAHHSSAEYIVCLLKKLNYYFPLSLCNIQVPTRPPQNLRAKNLTSEKSINVYWSPVPDGHVNGLLIGYSVKYQRMKTAEREVLDAEEHTLTLKSNELSILLQVRTYSTYRIKVAASTQKGVGPYSKYVYAGKYTSLTLS